MEQLEFKLEHFDGPLDLLLHLIDKDKVDIFDIPIVEITAQKPENQGLPWVVVATKVENLMLQSRIELFNKGTKFYLNKEMVVLVDSPILEITNMIIKDTMVYPDDEEMTVKDARYIQWGNGIHWYAKVGKFDVVDKDNNQKWNTKKEAQEATKWFIANYNN